MNLLADESVDRSIVERLRSDGHQVEYVAELSPGISDEEVLRQANDRGVVLVTADKDFGELVFRYGLTHPGVLLLRLGGQIRQARCDIAARVIRDHASEVPGAFTVVTPDTLRIRHSP